MDWKRVFWFENGKRFKGYAVINYLTKCVTLEGKNGNIFELLEEENINNGMTLQEIYDEIHHNITNYDLGGRQ